jgi:hypothetical protein
VKKVFLFLLIGSFCFSTVSWKVITPEPLGNKNFVPINSLLLYKQLNNTDLKFEIFEYALDGYLNLISQNKLDNSKYLTIIDMNMSSNSKRLFIINMHEKKIEYQSIVAHGRNSGDEFAKYFSNTINSHKSSIGFYKTAETYVGKHGLSLRLDGLEFSNNNARKRAIVIHSADYASEIFIKKYGRLGRSFGCPALPKKDYKEIIQKIKAGSALFIYSSNQDYLDKSNFIAGN